MRALLTLMLPVLILLLSGCGQKGDLYLPKEGRQAQLLQSGTPYVSITERFLGQ